MTIKILIATVVVFALCLCGLGIGLIIRKKALKKACCSGIHEPGPHAGAHCATCPDRLPEEGGNH